MKYLRLINPCYSLLRIWYREINDGGEFIKLQFFNEPTSRWGMSSYWNIEEIERRFPGKYETLEFESEDHWKKYLLAEKLRK